MPINRGAQNRRIPKELNPFKLVQFQFNTYKLLLNNYYVLV